MEFEKLKFNDQPTENMIKNSNEFLKMIRSRRTVREFSDKNVPMSIIKNILKPHLVLLQEQTNNLGTLLLFGTRL